MAGESASEFARRQREKAARLQRSAEKWERGAQGEETTALALRTLGASWSVFHDVRWPGRPRANIDHVVVGPTGVFVIDSKNWSGDVRVVGDVLHQGSRRREREVAAAAEAALAITQLLQGLASTPVLCFVRPKTVEGRARDVLICSPQNLVATLATQPPVLGPESIRRVTAILRRHLTAATAPNPSIQRHGPSQFPAGKVRRSDRRTVAGQKIARRMLGLGFRLLMVLLVVGVGIAVVGGVLDGVRQATEGGVGVQRSSAPKLGDAVSLPRTDSHPALRVQADKIMRVAPRPDFPAQPNQRLVAVRYSIENLGSEMWGATSPYLQFSALASNGQQVPSASYSALPPAKLMPAAFNLQPGKVRRGFVVYVVPDGSKLVRVSMHAYVGSSDAVEWLIP